MYDTDSADVVREHIAAFNRRDLDALIDGFADDAVWRTGRDTARGHTELRELFSAAMEHLLPTLQVRSLLSDDGRVAAQIVETLVVDGDERIYPIAGFYEIDAGRIRSATIYREGSADVV